MEKNTETDMQVLYRTYEYSAGAQFPELDLRCGSLENYVKTEILSREEADLLWKPKDMWK